MSTDFGELDYSDDQALVPGKKFLEGPASELCRSLDPYALELDALDLSFLGEKVGEKDNKDLLEARFAAFGWHAIQVDGHDYDALAAAFEEAKNTKDQPTVLIANTVKGYGSAIMENKAGWHHHVPSPEEYEQIMSDFAARKEAALHE